ncbi:MAG: hypothetical protein R3A45_00735 [Bdellovibrionota bacterium]|nr:hypothetical protein [Deltaproteobacteria bacterium]
MRSICSVLIVFFTISLYSCSSGGGNFTSKIFPSGLSITSPTAPESSNTSTTSLHAIGAFDSTNNFAEKKAVLQNLASGNDECTFVFPNFVQPFNSPACYGPELFINNHPNNPLDTQASLPSGDLGIWEENQDAQACAAAKLNAEVGNVGQKVDAALLFVAGMSCLIESESDLKIPEEGNTTNLTTALSDALASDNPNLTITAATIRRLADASDGFEVFQYEIEAEDSSGRELKIHLKHHPTNSSGSTFKGKMWTSIETENASEFTNSNSYAFSLLYEQDEDMLNFQNLATAYESQWLTSDDIFDGENNIDPTACSGFSSCWENFSQTIGNIDKKTGYGALSYGWQAGRLDADGSTPLARIFNFYVDDEDQDNINAYAFFGFGRGFNKDNGTIGSNTINRFICNWAGPMADRSGLENTAQKQVMLYNEASQLFESSQALITYAPTNLCTYDGQGTFAFSTDATVDLDDAQNEAGAIDSDLIDLTTDADYANYIAPTVPEEDF